MKRCRIKNKKKYRTEKEALRAMFNLWRYRGEDITRLHVYTCPLCGFLHVGHIPQEKNGL